jgi:beta-catenin-like protein 1
MTSVDELFKRPGLPTSNKRKLSEAPSPSQILKSAKLAANGDAKRSGRATVEDAADDDDGDYGPAAPPEDDEDYGPQAPPDDEDGDDEEGRFFGGGVDRGTATALDYIDSHDAAEEFAPEKMDKAWLRKTAISFEKRINANAEQRAKYEDDPQKFMASEADLDADIKALSILSEHPELYEEFAKMGCAGSLVGLLAHENTDIAIDAIEIIAELTDEDVPAEDSQWESLVDAMMEADLLSLLVSNFDRFDETVETDRAGIYHSLSLLENLASRSKVAGQVGEESKILEWLLARLQRPESPITQNKQYSTEVFSILLSSSPENVTRVLSLPTDPIDALLQLLAPYRKRDPPTGTLDEENAENLFDILAVMVSVPKGKTLFIAAEGIELALIMLREGKFSKPRALRLLDHAASAAGGATEESREVCEKIVDAAGLKTLFGMIMKKQDGSTTEHLLGIFAAMLRSLPGDSPPRIRTLAKFVEKDYEKLAKVVSIRRQYASRLAAADAAISAERRGMPPDEQQLMVDEWFSRRLDAGLFVLQTIDVILAWLVAEDGGAKKRIVELLKETDEDLGVVRATLKEQVSGLDDNASTESEEGMLKDMLSTLLDFLD